MALHGVDRESELIRERVPEDDPACGWSLCVLGLGFGIMLGLVVWACMGSLFTWL